MDNLSAFEKIYLFSYNLIISLAIIIGVTAFVSLTIAVCAVISVNIFEFVFLNWG